MDLTELNPLKDAHFDVNDPDGWFRYVADSMEYSHVNPSLFGLPLPSRQVLKILQVFVAPARPLIGLEVIE